MGTDGKVPDYELSEVAQHLEEQDIIPAAQLLGGLEVIEVMPGKIGRIVHGKWIVNVLVLRGQYTFRVYERDSGPVYRFTARK